MNMASPAFISRSELLGDTMDQTIQDLARRQQSDHYRDKGFASASSKMSPLYLMGAVARRAASAEGGYKWTSNCFPKQKKRCLFS